MNSPYDIRQLHMMLERITRYKNHESSLKRLVNDLESLYGLLENKSKALTEEFFPCWETLEIESALMSCKKQKVPSEKSQKTITRALDRLERAIQAYLDDPRYAGPTHRELSDVQGLCAMILFLSKCDEKQSFGNFTELIEGLRLDLDDKSGNPVFWHDWKAALKTVSNKERNTERTLTELQTFKAMKFFLAVSNRKGYLHEAKELFSVLRLGNGGMPAPLIWDLWMESVENILSEPGGLYPAECRLALKK